MHNDPSLQNFRLAVISDIHGNLPAFDAVMRALKSYDRIDRILVAGDVVGGPHDDHILRQLQEMKAEMVLGNNEAGILALDNGTAPPYHYHTRQFSLVRWCWKHLSPEMLAILHVTPYQREIDLPGCAPVGIVHGSPRDVWELVNPYENKPGFDEISALIHDPVIIFGHTHRAWHFQWNGRMAMNPGAVRFLKGIT